MIGSVIRVANHFTINSKEQFVGSAQAQHRLERKMSEQPIAEGDEAKERWVHGARRPPRRHHVRRRVAELRARHVAP